MLPFVFEPVWLREKCATQKHRIKRGVKSGSDGTRTRDLASWSEPAHLAEAVPGR
jgi:hypothetical protein